MVAGRWIALGVAAALVLVLALWLRQKPERIDVSVPKAPASVTGTAPASVPITMAPEAKNASAEFNATRADLERRAAAGERAAAERLSRVLLTCDGYREMTPEQIETGVVNVMAQFSPATQQAVEATLDAASIAVMVQAQFEKLRAVCAGADDLHVDTAQREQALAWAREAADAGSTRAMLTYAAHAFDRYASNASLLRNADEVRQRKLVARTYLERAAVAGDAEVFALRADLHTNGGLLSRDLMAAYANYYAYAHSAAASPDAALMLRIYVSAVDDESRQQAEQLAQQWLAHCCVETGLGQ